MPSRPTGRWPRRTWGRGLPITSPGRSRASSPRLASPADRAPGGGSGPSSSGSWVASSAAPRTSGGGRTSRRAHGASIAGRRPSPSQGASRGPGLPPGARSRSPAGAGGASATGERRGSTVRPAPRESPSAPAPAAAGRRSPVARSALRLERPPDARRARPAQEKRVMVEPVHGRALPALPRRPPQTYPASRTCEAQGCGTILSRYNPAPFPARRAIRQRRRPLRRNGFGGALRISGGAAT